MNLIMRNVFSFNWLDISQIQSSVAVLEKTGMSAPFKIYIMKKLSSLLVTLFLFSGIIKANEKKLEKEKAAIKESN